MARFHYKVFLLLSAFIYFLLITEVITKDLDHKKHPTYSSYTKNEFRPEERSFQAAGGRSLLIKSFFLAPLGIIFIALAALALLPLPVITIPTGREYQGRRSIDIAKGVLTSEECMERIACEISVVTKKLEVISWIPKSVQTFMKHTRWIVRVSRGFNTSKSCSQFACHPMKTLNKITNPDH